MIEKGFRTEMLPEIRRFLFCGETLAPETAAQLLERFPVAEVWNTYGPTEATVATTSVRVNHALLERFSPLPVGYQMTGTHVVVVDENNAAVAEGERGEILIAGQAIRSYYLKHVVGFVRDRLPVAAGTEGLEDNLDRLRRFEKQYPAEAARIEAILQLPVEDSAQAQLDFVLGLGGFSELQLEQAAVVKERLGWL